MADESFQEKTEKATPRRREKAREKGQVAKSNDLNAAAVVCLGFTALFMIGPYVISHTTEIMRYTMANAPSIAAADPTFTKVFADNVAAFLTTIIPVFVAMLVIGVGINIAQVGFKISPKALEPKFDKLDVVSGLKKLFAVRSLVHMVRDITKLAAIGIVAYLAVRHEFDSFFLLPDQSVAQIGATIGFLVVKIALEVGAVILVIGVLDFIYQRYEFEKSIKMSKQEIKDEGKDTEGNPQIKSRVRQIQREMARRRMMADVPTADVVVTNPTHIAVALKYDQSSMDAPTVVAKGERLVAEKIKEIARQHGIPVVEDKPLARALFKAIKIGEIVPAKFYRAVAEILAHIYRLNGKKVQ